MICSLEDSITLLCIRSHRQAEAARACVASAAGMPWGGAIGSWLGALGVRVTVCR
jgi:hypothetical protein